MSNAYLKKLEKEGSIEMRDWCKRPGKRLDGKPLYHTEQSHKKECDVNLILKKYDKTGLITHVQSMEARYGDVTGADFRVAQDLFIKAQRSFDELPNEIRKRFRNSAGEFLEFMEDPNNRDEAIKLGLIRGDERPEYDGLGEHVTADDYKAEKERKEKENYEKAV